jgi:hypothetical protein
MAIPLNDGTNLHGTLVLASSSSTNSGAVGQGNTELNIPIGTTVTTGNSLTSANVLCPGTPQSCIALVKMSSGTYTAILDTTSDGTTPTFASANKVSVTGKDGLPIYVGPVVTAGATTTNNNGQLSSTAAENVVALKITNNSGATLTVDELRLIVAVVFGDEMAWHDDRTGYLDGAAPTASQGTDDETGTFVLNT